VSWTIDAAMQANINAVVQRFAKRASVPTTKAEPVEQPPLRALPVQEAEWHQWIMGGTPRQDGWRR